MSINKNDPEIQAAIAKCYLSTKTFCRTIFPERFSRPFSSITDQIFKVLDDPTIQKAVIAAPRGWGKSSIVNMAYPAKSILFNDRKFIIPVSCTATQAEERGEDLKAELLSNKIISSLWGPMESKTFAKERWITSNGVMVFPRGAGQQVRGALHLGNRPDLIIVDDLENSEGVKNEEQRKKLREWFFSDLVNCVDRSSNNWKIVVIGTILHEDALLTRLLEDPDWVHLKLEICDDNYHSNWPEFMNDAQVRDLAESYAEKGLLHIFAMEYRNSVISQDSAFQQTYFKYYDEGTEKLWKERDVENMVLYDPAKTTNPKSAFTAIVGWGVNVSARKYYIRDVINEKLHPEEQYKAACEMCKRINSRVLGVEVTGLNEFITHPLRTFITKNQHLYGPIEVIELQARGGMTAASKESRVRALIPFYRQGLIYHNKSCCAPLEAQLISFPRSKYWDVMDCAAYIVEMLDKGGLYLGPPDDYDPSSWDDDHFNLGDDQPFEGWRVA
jgi:hypothetical protein